MSISRRQFVAAAGSATVLGYGTHRGPGFLASAAENDDSHEKRVLVVIQLSGGNDGLNTVVPFANEEYYKNRPKLAIAKSDVAKIDGSLGFHPSMRGFADLLQKQKLSIIQGVGYPNPNRSHFESMDIWHTCKRKDQTRDDGWLGRFLDSQPASFGGDVPAMHLGPDKQPFALAARRTRVPSVRSLESFRLNEGDAKGIRDTIEEVTRANRKQPDDLLGFVQSSAAAALDASRRVEQAQNQAKSTVQYPSSSLAERLEKISLLIHAGLATRIYYVTHGGFDTHSRQPAAHASLLDQFSSAVTTFVKDLEQQGTSDRVLIMAFSEFGRRVRENASEGTDHGTAGPMFLVGSTVKPGLVGSHPDLNDLNQGDLKHQFDFRQVYSCLLQRWMAGDSEKVLGAKFAPVDALTQNAS